MKTALSPIEQISGAAGTMLFAILSRSEAESSLPSQRGRNENRMGEMANLAAGPMVHGAWVGQCPGCGTCCYFPKLPPTDYAGQQLVRPQGFNLVSVLCACGNRFGTDSNSLTFVTCTSLSIERMSPDSFAVAETYADTKSNLGPMSEIALWSYLNSRTLIDIIPSQVLMFLSKCKALDMDMVVSVVRPPRL